MPARHTMVGAVMLSLAMGLTACGTQSAHAPIEPPARSSFARVLIAQGATLAALGNCADCHTAAGGKPYAGGRPLTTPLGTIYGTNITPDPQTGIGQWSEAAFFRAMREGVDREGRHLYPAFSYDHFTKLADDDLRALYAFVMTRDPVRAEVPVNALPFPLNNRSLIGAWKALFFEPGRFKPDAARSAEWNRGAYLVQGLGHCGACHTPRNALGAEIKSRDLGAGTVEGWHAPALNADSPAPVPWTAQALYTYLRTGLDDLHAIAAGPMEPVVRNLAAAPQQDVRAIAAYVAALAGRPTVDRRKKAEAALLNPESVGGDPAFQNGAAIYAGACADCHDRGRDASSGAALHLALGSAMTIPTSANLIRITLEGITPPNDAPGRFMPGFASAFTDAQVKDLVGQTGTRWGPKHRDRRRKICNAFKSISFARAASNARGDREMDHTLSAKSSSLRPRWSCSEWRSPSRPSCGSAADLDQSHSTWMITPSCARIPQRPPIDSPSRSR